MKKSFPNINLGVLGGGQLGKMLGIAAADWHLPIHFLDQSNSFPASAVATSFTEGSFKDYEAVMAFGSKMDVLTIEIEHVNTQALHELEQMGKIVHPRPAALDLIKDKGLQKSFYQEKALPTSTFQLFTDKHAVKSAIESGELTYPFVQKSRTAGYDGKGVAILKGPEDAAKLLPGGCVIEPLVDIEKELAVIVARNTNGAIQTFPLVEMLFNPDANLVEFLACPASVDPAIAKTANEIAISTIEAFDLCGLLAVELFLTKTGAVLINEVAPRPHNSGHHTIDSCVTSQFEQHLRAVLNLPLGDTQLHSNSIMVNLLGHPDSTGPAIYEGVDQCMAQPGVHIHLYGKAISKPYRKMGHVTVTAPDLEQATQQARWVKEHLIVKGQP